MSGIDPSIHAVHFDDVLNEGEVEFKGRGVSPKAITSGAAFNIFVGRWNAAAPPPPPPSLPPVAGARELQLALLKKGIITQAELNAEL
jgi:hypothetical protein